MANVRLDIRQELLNYFQGIIDETGMKLGNELERKLNRLAPSKYYDRRGDAVYALKNPPKLKYKGSKLSIDFVDSKLLKPSKARRKGNFNHRMSWKGYTKWYGGDVGGYIPDIVLNLFLNDGFTIVFRNGKEKKYPGLHFIESSLKTDDYISYIETQSINRFEKFVKELMKV